MDLYQRKLTKTEWNSIEVPVSGSEKEILKLIVDGYDNVNIRYNKHVSMMGILKLTYNEGIEDYLYKTYLESEVLERAETRERPRPEDLSRLGQKMGE